MISNESITSKSCQTIHPKQIRATISTVTIAYEGIIYIYMHITYIIQVSLFLHSHEFLKKNTFFFSHTKLSPHSGARHSPVPLVEFPRPGSLVVTGGGADTEANIWWKKHNFFKVDFLGVFLLYPRHLWNLHLFFCF